MANRWPDAKSSSGPTAKCWCAAHPSQVQHGRAGKLHRRENEWLPTGDIAEVAPTGDLRFLGRKSEVIVTAAGLNVHPEDLEAAIEVQPGVAACAVVPMETAEGSEPCAVIAMRGSGDRAAQAIESANARLADFQRLRRWVLWPEPDLPRTSTGKVRRKAVAEWLRNAQSASTQNGATKSASNGAFAAAGAFAAKGDWLLSLIAQITGESHAGIGDELRLTEDLHLDSLGRVQLAAAIEDRLGIVTEDGMLNGAETLGDLRRMIAGELAPKQPVSAQIAPPHAVQRNGASITQPNAPEFASTHNATNNEERQRDVYPRWPWLLPFRWIRVAFIEIVMRPLVWLLANPRVTTPKSLKADAPLLIIANHVSTFDGPLIQYALPRAIRRHMAAAMSGEMLNDYRHFRNPEKSTGSFFLPGPLFYYLLTGLFNVFPLPRLRDFQPSFAHAGKVMDRGYHVLVFPEGTRSAEGKLARFRSGIGLLAKQSGAMVLPVALRGLGELKTRNRRWFRSGKIEVRIGEPLRILPTESEADIAARLHDEVERLLHD